MSALRRMISVLAAAAVISVSGMPAFTTGADEVRCVAIGEETSKTLLGAGVPVYRDLRRKDLTRRQKTIYDKIVSAFRHSKKTLKTLRFNYASGNDLSTALYAVNNTWFRYYGGVCGASWYYDYGSYITWQIQPGQSRYRRSRSVENERKLKKIAARVTKGKRTTKAKVLAINKYVCNKLTYRMDKGTLDTALRTRYSKCSGYAALFMALCQKSGIPCHMVVGDAGGGHAWNEVKISGSWYYIDPTWYDSGRRSQWLLTKHLWYGRSIWAILHIVDFRQCGYTNGI